MMRVNGAVIVCVALAFVFSLVAAEESKELRKQRQAAQKERQLQKNERAKELNEATKAFRAFARELQSEYADKVAELEIEFELKRVELRAEHDARVAEAEADYQKKLSGLFMKPGITFDEQTIERLQAEGKAFADELFVLRKQSAEAQHRERIAKEQRENAILTERDRRILEQASALGLTRDYAPILATPLGDGLTQQEERWNERETNEVDILRERNNKAIAEFRNGESLRKWEIGNLEEDFQLKWDEKAQSHALDSQQLFYNAMFMQAAQGGEVDQSRLVNRLTELNEKKKLIGINYRQIRDQKRIKRQEERKAILAR